MSTSNFQSLAHGDYCLATRWPDGMACDPWVVGFYVGNTAPHRFSVFVDNEGIGSYRLGFRRCQKITREQGDYLLANAKKLEDAGIKLWELLSRLPSIDSHSNLPPPPTDGEVAKVAARPAADAVEARAAAKAAEARAKEAEADADAAADALEARAAVRAAVKAAWKLAVAKTAKAKAAEAKAAALKPEVAELANELSWIVDRLADIGWSDHSGAATRAAELLQRQATPLKPIPVSERPWDRDGWCDEKGECWMGDPGGEGFIPSWRKCRPEDAPSMSVSLPADALPLPISTENTNDR